MKLTAYLHVSERTGKPFLRETGFNPRGKRAYAVVAWTNRHTAKLNCGPGERVVKVCITGKP